MSETPLHSALETALSIRQQRLVPVTDLYDQLTTPGPDLFSNDYLSLTSNDTLRHKILAEINRLPILLGTGGPRLTTGNSLAHVEFEERMKISLEAPAALLFNSGYDANVGFWQAVPQAHDAVVFDELVHASTRDGLIVSRARNSLYPFQHNSLSSLRQSIVQALAENTAICDGNATIFIAAESLYGMDGDFAPLLEIVHLVDELVPRAHRHIVVDEAHTTGICGPLGRGLVHALGLGTQVDTVAHSFGKARALVGAVILTSPIIRKYLINYGRPFIYSTSLPLFALCALNASFDYIESPAGSEQLDVLRCLCEVFDEKLRTALKNVLPNLLRYEPHSLPYGYPSDIFSPIFPILTSTPISLASYLRNHGYAARPIPYPVVPRGRECVRIVIHAANVEEELDDLVAHLLDWASVAQAILNRPKHRRNDPAEGRRGNPIS